MRPDQIHSMAIVSPEEALGVIGRMRALVKTVSVDPDSDRCIDYFLAQVESPKLFRPVKTLPAEVNRLRLFNPRTEAWETRQSYGARGRAKVGKRHTKKTALSLLPADGIMKLFVPKHGFPVGLIFDSESCDLKNEKYVFDKNVETDRKWWLQKDSSTGSSVPGPISLKLEGLRSQLALQQTSGHIPNWNEVLAGVNSSALKAIFIDCDHDVPLYRLLAIHTKFKVKEKLNIDLPLLIARDHLGVSVYTKEEQLSDLQAALSSPFFRIATTQLRELQSKIRTDIQLSGIYPSIAALSRMPENPGSLAATPTAMQAPRPSAPPAITPRAAVPIHYQPHEFYRHLSRLDTGSAKRLVDETASLESIKYISVLYRENISYGTEGAVRIDPETQHFTLSPLLLSLMAIDRAQRLDQKNEIIRTFIRRFPNEINHALNNIAYLDSFYMVDDFQINPSQLELYKSRLLLELPKEFNYNFNYAEKVKIKENLLGKIDTFDSEQDLKDFYNQYKDKLCLTQHRHATWDRFFKPRNAMTRTQSDILEAVQKRFLHLTGREESLTMRAA